jgi:hypothetical protein
LDRNAKALLHEVLSGRASPWSLTAEDWAQLEDELVDAGPGHSIARICAALVGRFDANQLSEDEAHLFSDLFASYLMQPNPESGGLAERMRKEGGYVGENDHGALVRVLPGGKGQLL